MYNRHNLIVLCLCLLARERRKSIKWAGEGENGNKGPGENVILVNMVTQGPGLPDGDLEGLAKAALALPSQRSTNGLSSSLFKQTNEE